MFQSERLLSGHHFKTLKKGIIRCKLC